MLRNTMGVCAVEFPEKKRYEGVRFNDISVTRGWGLSNFQKKSVTKVYSSMILVLREGGGCQISRKKALQRCMVQRY